MVGRKVLWPYDPTAVYSTPPLLLPSAQLYNLSVFTTELRVKRRQLVVGVAAGQCSVGTGPVLLVGAQPLTCGASRSEVQTAFKLRILSFCQWGKQG